MIKLTLILNKFGNKDHYYSTHYNKRQLFDMAVSQLMHNKMNGIKQDIIFNEDNLRQLTKNSKQLIKELLNDKKILPIDNGFYKINYQKVFCKSCYRESFIREKTKDKESNDFKTSDNHFYIWEIKHHLEYKHYFNQKAYDWESDKSIRNPITQESIDSYISMLEPVFEICDHDYELISMVQEFYDKLEINLVCKKCNYDKTIRDNQSTCLMEVQTKIE